MWMKIIAVYFLYRSRVIYPENDVASIYHEMAEKVMIVSHIVIFISCSWYLGDSLFFHLLTCFLVEGFKFFLIYVSIAIQHRDKGLKLFYRFWLFLFYFFIIIIFLNMQFLRCICELDVMFMCIRLGCTGVLKFTILFSKNLIDWTWISLIFSVYFNIVININCHIFFLWNNSGWYQLDRECPWSEVSLLACFLW